MYRYTVVYNATKNTTTITLYQGKIKIMSKEFYGHLLDASIKLYVRDMLDVIREVKTYDAKKSKSKNSSCCKKVRY